MGACVAKPEPKAEQFPARPGVSGPTLRAPTPQQPSTSSSSTTTKSQTPPSQITAAKPEEEEVVKVPRPKDSNPKLSKANSVQVQTDFASQYELGKQLGKGNYSVVHQATKRDETKLSVAVKMVNKRGLDMSDVTDIKEEVSILRDLDDHKHIIQLFGLFEDFKHYYIVTEIMSGGELFDEIVEREFYWERDAQEVVRMLASAIGYMHSKGLVHRDLKPENVLLTSKGPEGKVKLADFGFAARIDQVELYPLNCACGTPGYVAPEIVSGLTYGREVDMWSLGVISFILLGGYPPFHDEDQQELFRMIRRGRYSFDPAFWGLVSEDAKNCVKSMLCVDRTKRAKAGDVLEHVWLKPLQKVEITEELAGGVGGRGQGLEGRGQGESINLSPALRELRKFQARQRWRDGMALAMAREGQVFGRDIITRSLLDVEKPVQRNRMVDISMLDGIGKSETLATILADKRQRNNMGAAKF